MLSICDIEEVLKNFQNKCLESLINFLEIELKKFVDNKLILIGQAELIPVVHLTFDKSSNQFQIAVKSISIFSNGKSGNANCDVDLLEALGYINENELESLKKNLVRIVHDS